MRWEQRFLNILVALDQFLFCLVCLGYTVRGETASSAAWSLEASGKLVGILLRPTIDTLFWFDPDHCRNSWAKEQRTGK